MTEAILVMAAMIHFSIQKKGINEKVAIRTTTAVNCGRYSRGCHSSIHEKVSDENINLFQDAHLLQESEELNLSKKLGFRGVAQHLPDFISLQCKLENAHGAINLAHENLGNDRCIILSRTLIESSENPHSRHCKFVSIDDDSYDILSLSLCDNRITDKGMITIMRNFSVAQRLHNLRHLDLSGNKIGKDGAMALAKCLCKLSELQRLNLSNMNISDGVFYEMFCLLRTNDLTNDDVSTTSIDEDDKPYLRSLKLSKNKLGTMGARALATYLESSAGSELLELDISWNVLGIDGAAYLWSSLTRHKYLIALDVSWNCLGDHNHEEMAEKLRKPTEVNPLTIAVRTMSEGSKEIGDGGIIHAKERSVDKPSKIEIDTKSDQTNHKTKRVKYQSAMALKHLLQTNDTLLHLSIAHNSLCAKECEIIGQGLQHNHTLLGIHVTGIRCSMFLENATVTLFSCMYL